MKGRVAQLVEQGTENPCVGSSNLSPATIILLPLALLLHGCTGLVFDQCEQLCLEVGVALDGCDRLEWEDLGAASREAYISECRSEWNDVAADGTARELELGIGMCEEARDEVADLTCDELVALYGE